MTSKWDEEYARDGAPEGRPTCEPSTIASAAFLRRNRASWSRDYGLALLVLGLGATACTGTLRFQAVPPPPPPVAVVATVSTPEAAPAPEPAPAAPAEAAPTEPTEGAPVAEIVNGEPEELTASTEPPEPIYEEQLDAPGGGYVWVGGYWGWTGTDWGWNAGRWALAPEGRVYVEPYYERVGSSVVYVPGYWGGRDYRVRSYGGSRIRFAAPMRPADYRRGEYRRFDRRPGAQPGSRSAVAYERANGVARPLPRATQPVARPTVGEMGPGHEARPMVAQREPVHGPESGHAVATAHQVAPGGPPHPTSEPAAPHPGAAPPAHPLVTAHQVAARPPPKKK